MLLTTIAYHPDLALRSRLSEALEAGFDVWVFDNTPGGAELLTPLRDHPAFHCQDEDRKNQGLGKGMRLLMQAAAAKGHKQILYFDQDTLFSVETLVWAKKWLSLHPDQLAPLAAVQFTSAGNYLPPEMAQLQPTPLLINSGCVFFADALQAMGWHDASFFVEGVDYKFCLDAAHAGYRLGMLKEAPGIDHEELQPRFERYFLGRHYHYRIYPRQRKINFIKALLRLATTSALRGHYRYAYVFLRNIATFLTTQTAYALVHLLGKPIQKAMQ